MNELRTLLLEETWALPMGVGVLAVLSVVADSLGPDWWPDACGPLLLAVTTTLVLASIWRTRAAEDQVLERARQDSNL